MSVQILSADAGGGGPPDHLSPQGHASPSLFTLYKVALVGCGPPAGACQQRGGGAHTSDGEVIVTSGYLKLHCGQNILMFFI